LQRESLKFIVANCTRLQTPTSVALLDRLFGELTHSEISELFKLLLLVEPRDVGVASTLSKLELRLTSWNRRMVSRCISAFAARVELSDVESLIAYCQLGVRQPTYVMRRLYFGWLVSL
jgi:hypothetical protein